MSQSSPHSKQSLNALTLAALGIVFGDIGTSPLYAVRETFHGPHAIPISPENIMGILSLIVWSLIVIISVKYLLFVMRADNNGEGGVLALTAIAAPRTARKDSQFTKSILYLGLFGSALLFGDGVITPAISVLSAVEGLGVATPFFEPFIIPLTVAILFALFFNQHYGTAKIGAMFGPIILVWFLTLATLGLYGSLSNPFVFGALNPSYAVSFFVQNGWTGIFALGTVFLVVTGGEALYADMGHLGRKPIQRAWFFVALPGLLLNYFGQGALLLANPEAVVNPFYLLAPSWALYPLVIIATLATVIASQALITGVFSLTRQALQLGYTPRVRIVHTSTHEIGQIYIPNINWLLFILTAWLVVGFGSSSALASAYGIAVCITMVVTTILTCTVAFERWKWNGYLVFCILALFLIVDGAFLSANIVKIADGGWFPLVLAVIIFTLMTTWRTGRRVLKERTRVQSLPLDQFLNVLRAKSPTRVPGTAVFMTGDQKIAPLCFTHNVEHNKVLHEKSVILTVITKEIPTVAEIDRVEIDSFEFGIVRVVAKYGFMETPDIKDILRACEAKDLIFDREQITYFLGRETLIPSHHPGMAVWREHLFSFMSRNAEPATRYFNLPANQVIEVGMQVEI